MRRRTVALEQLTPDEMRAIVRRTEEVTKAIAPVSVTALRNRALIGVVGYTWASVDSVVAMRVRDYYWLGDQRWIRLVEDGEERRELVHPTVQNYIDEYLEASDIGADPWSPLFRNTFANGRIDSRSMSRKSAKVIVNRALDTPRSEHRINVPASVPESIPNTFADLRDCAIAGLLQHVELKPSAVAALRVGHYVRSAGNSWIRVAADRRIPVPPALASILHDYLKALGPVDRRTPLFSDENGRMSARDIQRMVRRSR